MGHVNTGQEPNVTADDEDTSHEQSGDLPDEQFHPTIKELEESVWHAKRGPGTKAVAWLILICLGACLIGLVIIMIIAALQ